MLSRLYPPGVAKTLQGGQPGHRDGGGLIEGQDRRLAGELVLAARAYSANEPRLMPNTSSPAPNRVTPAPAATTVPATSSPGTGFLGARSPETRRIRYGWPYVERRRRD